MATLAVQMVTEEIEKVTNENSSCQIVSKITNKEVSANSSEDIRVNLTNENLVDSGISSCKSDSDISVLTNREGKLDEFVNKNSNQEAEFEKESVKEQYKEHTNSNINSYSQESKESNCFTKSNYSLDPQTTQSSNSNSNNTYKKIQTTQNSNSNSISILNSSQAINNDDENSCSSIASSVSTIKTTQSVSEKLDDKSNSSSQFSRRNNSPEKKSINEKTLANGESTNINLVLDNDSCSSFTNSHIKSVTKNSLPDICNSGDESKSSFSFQSKSQSSSRKQRENASTHRESQSVKSDISEDSSSHSFISSANNEFTNKNNQCKITKSDDENNTQFGLKLSNNNSPVEKNEVQESQAKKYLSIVDSDSEDEIIVRPKLITKVNTDVGSKNLKNDKSLGSTKKSTNKNKRKMIDSDSDEESSTTVISKETPSDMQVDNHNSINENSKLIDKSKKISNIVDSDSDSGSENQNESKNLSSCEENGLENNEQRNKLEKKRKGSARASKDAAMQQIHSETQRLIRESALSLPYHKPKQRTLQEFLNRKKMTSTIPKNLTCAEKVKMFSDVISKVVKEKEKEAELFYKSSDSEDDKENNETIKAVDQINIKHNNKNDIQLENIDDTSIPINIGDTQKLTQDSIQDCHNKREILQQRSLDFGVPRKLFMEDAIQMEETENIEGSEELENLEENLNSDGILAVNKKIKEVKSGLRESSIPRKLFLEDTEDMDTDVYANKTSASVSEQTNCHISKTLENTENNLENCQTATELENSTEDIVLNMSETEHDLSDDKKLTEISKASEPSTENIIKNQENIMISETPFLSHKDLPRSNRLSISHSKDQSATETDLESLDKSKEIDNPVLKLSEEVNDIIDQNVLRADFGLPPEVDEPIEKVNIKQKILAKVLKTTPIIKASPGSVIEFTNMGQMREGVTKLLDRFARHSAVVKPKAEKVAEVKIIRTEGIGDDVQLIEEILPFNKTIIEDEVTKESKPGEKLQKLKEDLRQKIASARNEEWKQKEEYENENEEEEEGTKCKGDDFYQGLPDEEEILEDEESGESEPEENDIPIVDKKRLQCEFGDEEAEESETEDVDETDVVEDAEKETEEEEEENEEDEEDEEEDEDEDEVADEDEKSNDESGSKPRKLKRIIRPVEDYSSDSNSSSSNIIIEKLSFESAKGDEDIFATQASNDNMEIDVIPPFQIRDRSGSDSRSQSCNTPVPKSGNILSMISPVAQLTVLKSLDSAKKSGSKLDAFEFSQISASNTPSDNSNRPQITCNMEKISNLQKKLFEDPVEPVNDDELLALCSGKFNETQFNGRFTKNAQKEVTDSQIMGVCSGAFVTQADDLNKIEVNNSRLNYEDKSLKPFGKEVQNEVTDSQLMDICSGAFVTQAATDMKKMEVNNSRLNYEDKPLKTFGKEIQNEVTDSQIMDVCSGAFVTQQADMKKLESNNAKNLSNNLTSKPAAKDDQNGVTNSQIMDLCSGPFFTQLPSMKKLESSNSNVQNNDDSSQDITLTLEDDDDTSSLQAASVKRSDESMFSSDSKSPVNKPFSFNTFKVKNPMEAWLKNANEKSAIAQLQQKSSVSDSQLLDLCSGPFLSQPVDLKEPENDKSSEMHKKESGDLQLSTDNSINPIKKNKKQTDLKNLESPTKDEESQRPGYRIVSSDEDDNPEAKKAKRKKKALKKKKVQTLQLSDDEDASANEFPDEEESEIENEEEEEEEHYVDYDSDENEVIVVPKKEIKKVAANFLENEAELSESEWGSADEDEQDLDKLEFEEGDAENIDEAKMKNELDRIHMKQIMDEDQREVRMLQELLFDDGDLHSEGAGRERKFKWKNIDSLGDITLERTDDNGDLIEEEIDPELEVQMRKMRYEQQKFLEETQKDVETHLQEDFNESELLNFGLKVVSVRSSAKSASTEQKISKSNSIAVTNLTIKNNLSNVAKKPAIGPRSTTFSNVRGSFLSRGEDALVRIAQNLPKTSTAAINPAGKRKFVFQHLSPSVATEVKGNNEDDSDITPDSDAKKTRKRRIFSSQTPTSTKKLKVDDRAPGKKLF